MVHRNLGRLNIRLTQLPKTALTDRSVFLPYFFVFIGVTLHHLLSPFVLLEGENQFITRNLERVLAVTGRSRCPQLFVSSFVRLLSISFLVRHGVPILRVGRLRFIVAHFQIDGFNNYTLKL